MAVYGEKGFERAIHNIENSPFRTKFDKDVQEMEICRDGCDGEMAEGSSLYGEIPREVASSPRIRIIGADTIGYLPLEACDKIAAGSKCKFCKGCFTGEYPIAPPARKHINKYDQPLTLEMKNKVKK